MSERVVRPPARCRYCTGPIASAAPDVLIFNDASQAHLSCYVTFESARQAATAAAKTRRALTGNGEDHPDGEA
jgi:hypothetical protein